ncbi:MAG: hypothetical protein JWR22_2831 [Herminiimonas sp.]|nr:hypothetical protein [Herminiimonas sp.]
MNEKQKSLLTAFGNAITEHPDTDHALCAILHSALQYAESWARGITVDEVRVTVEEVPKGCMHWANPRTRHTIAMPSASDTPQ